MVLNLRLQPKRTAGAFVEEAGEMARSLEDRQNKAINDIDIARQIIANTTGISVSLLWSLRHRPPKTIAADVYNALCAAVERQALEKIGVLHHEISTARARRMGADNNAIREAMLALENARLLLRRETAE